MHIRKQQNTFVFIENTSNTVIYILLGNYPRITVKNGLEIRKRTLHNSVKSSPDVLVRMLLSPKRRHNCRLFSLLKWYFSSCLCHENRYVSAWSFCNVELFLTYSNSVNVMMIKIVLSTLVSARWFCDQHYLFVPNEYAEVRILMQLPFLNPSTESWRHIAA